MTQLDMTHSNTPMRDRATGEIAAALPGATSVFRKFRIDFCCHGNIALGEAAKERGIDVSAVELELAALQEPAASTPASLESSELIDHILNRYHETHRRELPELIMLALKVEAVHAEHPSVPKGLASLFRQMQGELEVHMKKEELILFPAMQRRVGGGLEAPISQMRFDHDDHGEQLQRLEALTNEFTPPSDACGSWRALYRGASKLADDLMEHIHIENNILFPRYDAPAAG